MRRLVLLGLLAVIAIPAGAAKPGADTRITVAQLEQALTAASVAHKSDAAIARQIGSTELSERLTEATLERLSANLKASSKAAMALHLLADQSAFLDPPASELPTMPAPDNVAQKQMLDALRNYASQTVLHLPNFLATRTETRFDNSHASSDNDSALHRVGNSNLEVSIRNDRENSATDQMTSWGEFGALLGMILNDSAHGWVTWSHWEQTPAGPAAVFRYFVPKAASHFAVNIPVLHPEVHISTDPDLDIMKRFGEPEASLPYDPKLKSPHPNSSSNSVVPAKPGYRGSVSFDPSAGTVLRITMEADASDIAPYERAAMMVQYGPVKIGDSSFTCPVRSLSMTVLDLSPRKMPATGGAAEVNCALFNVCVNDDARSEIPPTQWLNETLFTGYHRFAATTRILTGAAAPQGEPTHDEGSLPKPAQEISAATQQAVAIPAAQSRNNSNVATPATEQQFVAEPAASTQQAANPVPVPEQEPPQQTPPRVQAEASVEMSPGAQMNAPQNIGPTIQVNVNRVLVPVVVHDRQGHTVGDLKQEGFQVFDNNKPRVISAFTLEKRGTAEVNAASSPAGGVGPSAAPNATPPAPATPRFIVFLFDDRHLTLGDLAYSQKAAVKALDGALSGPSDRAVVLSTTGNVNSGLTADRAKLQEAIMAVKPQGILRATTTGCIKIDYYQADQIINGQNDSVLQDAVAQLMACTPGQSSEQQAQQFVVTTARAVLAAGLHDVLDTYAFIGGVVGKLATLPGQRTLILISPGFLNVDPAAEAMESRIIDFAAQSNVAIDALDARGVYTTVMSASDEPAGANLVLHDQMRNAAESQSDAPMANLADGTGGAFFHHSNDLDAGFTRLIETPEIAYLLEVSLDGVKADGKFHRLKVKVHRDGVDVKARSEFFMPKPAKGK